MIVLDASVVVEALVGNGDLGDRTRRRLAAAPQCHAPELIYVEVANALCRLTAAGLIATELADRASTSSPASTSRRTPTRPCSAVFSELRANLTAHDAAYVAVAEAVGGPLLTLDERLANAPVDCAVDVVV